MAKVTHHYTIDELNNNYEFKVVKKLLKQKYPWIKEIEADEEDLNDYSVIFLNIYVDTEKLSEETGYPIANYVRSVLDSGETYDAGSFINLIINGMNYEDARDLKDDIAYTADEVHRSPALPPELKLKGNRVLRVGKFFAT